jgi:hypothetical protein
LLLSLYCELLLKLSLLLLALNGRQCNSASLMLMLHLLLLLWRKPASKERRRASHSLDAEA